MLAIKASATAHVPHLPFSLDPLIAEAKRRARKRRRLTVAVVGVIAVASLAAAVMWTSASLAPSRGQVTMVSAQPWPEGPASFVASAAGPVSAFHVALAKVEKLIPSTLPKNPVQSCSFGTIVRLTLRDGKVVSYGPCERSASIERLRTALVKDGLSQLDH